MDAEDFTENIEICESTSNEVRISDEKLFLEFSAVVEDEYGNEVELPPIRIMRYQEMKSEILQSSYSEEMNS